MGCRYPSQPDPSPISKLSAPTPGTASLELKVEKQNAHTSGVFGSISSVQFSPDGSSIVSGGIEDKTIKVWDAGVEADTLEPLDQI